MKPPTNPPPSPRDKDGGDAVKRPGGHGSYRLGGEPAVGHSWDEAPAPPPATMTPFDDGVPHRPHPPGDIDPLHNEDVDHEHSDVNVRAVVGAAVMIAVVVLVSQVLMWGMFQVMESQAKDKDPALPPVARPGARMPANTQASPFFNESVGGPRLMVDEPGNLANQRSEEQKRLQGYGWVNQGAGVTHIPIDEAKKLIRDRGLPVREGEAVAPTVGTRAPSRGEASGGRMMMIGGAPANASPEHPTPAQPATPAAAPAPETPAAKPHGPGGQ